MSGAIADIAMFAVVALIIRCGAWIGDIVDRRTNKRWLGWIIGSAAACAIFAASIPTMHALIGVRCQSADDVQACIEDD